MKYFVTGGAGFIGSNMVDRLLGNADEVVVYDNFSTGHRRFLSDAAQHPLFSLVEGDVLNLDHLCDAMKGCDLVFHFAANADVRFGIDHPRKDLEQNTIATFHVLESMRRNQVRKIVFSSTGSIYGEASVIPTPEYAPFPIQTSLYGASKLAGEGMIQAYCEGFDFQAWIFRFVSILGERYTHGHVFDFYKNLQKNPAELAILGDGQQKKSYLYVQDCCDAIFFALKSFTDKVNIVNLGTNEYCTIDQSATWIAEFLRFAPRRYYTGGSRGWIGDNPFIFLDCSKINKKGWEAKYSIQAAVEKTLRYFQENPWILEAGR